MVLYPNKLPESERVCSGICRRIVLLAVGVSSGQYFHTQISCFTKGKYILYVRIYMRRHSFSVNKYFADS